MTSTSIDSPQSYLRHGFTLLEIIIVVGLMTMMISVAAFTMSAFDEEGSVRKPGNELIRLAKQAVNAAAVNGRGYWIRFDEEGFVFLSEEGSENDRFTLPPEVEVEILRFGGRDWEDAEGQAWLFGAQGICEPLQVRFSAPDSNLEMTFNPLTGTPSDEVMEVW
jgi:type II secretion system protein H